MMPHPVPERPLPNGVENGNVVDAERLHREPKHRPVRQLVVPRPVRRRHLLRRRLRRLTPDLRLGFGLRFGFGLRPPLGFGLRSRLGLRLRFGSRSGFGRHYF